MFSIDWGFVVNALAAIGSISAAVVALWIATSDRTERKKERAAADEAQAKLVLVWTDYGVEHSGSELDEVEFQLVVLNEGDQPILDIRIEKYVLRGVDGVTAQVPGGTIFRLTKAHSEARAGGVVLTDANGKRYPPRRTDKGARPTFDWFLPHPEDLDLFGWLGFTDLHGNRWARSSEGELRLIRKPTDLDRLSG